MLIPHAVTWIEITGVCLFSLAVLHTFSVKYFAHLAHTQPAHAGFWHLLGEVETVFGLWAFVLLAFMAIAVGWQPTTEYLDSRQFIEPMFVFVIMVMAASRPVQQLVTDVTRQVAHAAPVPGSIALYFLGLGMLPLLGSFITEPAAMTLAALMLRDVVFSRRVSNTLKYATIGALFVNVSIGGTLTHFAAPPILMVAAQWQWGTAEVFALFGWKAAIAVIFNAVALTLIFRRELQAKALSDLPRDTRPVPMALVLASLLMLIGVVAANHDPEVFVGLFLLFLGMTEAYKRHFGKLMLREGLMVALFLAGLVILGGQQKWWLQALLSSMDETTLFYGATLLTAITDNAALTYLGSLVDGVSAEFKYALVAGAVAGGGLTVIANAPNPAGYSILKASFEEQSINPFWLLLGAIPPTLVAVFCFRGLHGSPFTLFSLAEWQVWFESLDRGFLFLLMLPFVVAAVALWNHQRESALERSTGREQGAASGGLRDESLPASFQISRHPPC